MVIKSITMVGNECEIIESFVRYNINIIDEMIFILNMGSVDQSLNILKMLKEEGLKIRIYDEPLVLYEQKAIENKYIKMVAEEKDNDLIIPLDADEFIASGDTTNPRHILEQLNLDYIYKLKWINYTPTDNDDLSEKFIPKRITYCDEQSDTFDKVIIPSGIIQASSVMVSTGHHDVAGFSDFEYLPKEMIYIAHYPLTSEEQYKNKIYCSSVNFIGWTNRGDGEGTHLNIMLDKLEKGEKLNPSLYNNSQKISEMKYKPLYLDFIEESDDKLSVKYKEETKIDLTKNLLEIARIMAIKSYSLELESKFRDGKKRILIYGTGKAALDMVSDIPEDLVNIVAYVDSNNEKKFTYFRKRLVISPQYIRLFKYDKIIISSNKYSKEMKMTLMDHNVDERNIAGPDYLLMLQIKDMSEKNLTYKR